MMENTRGKSPTQVHFCLGRDERIFLKKHKTTNTHYLKRSSGRDANNDSIAVNHFMYHETRHQLLWTLINEVPFGIRLALHIWIQVLKR